MLEIDIKPRRKRKGKLTPIKVDASKKVIPKGDARKPRYWRVNLGKKLTGTSKQRRFFDTEAEAIEFIRTVEGAATERGKSAFDIPQALAVEAMTLDGQLRTHGMSLTDAVKFFLRHAPIHGKKTLNELMPAYLAEKTEGSYRYAQEIALGVFAKDFGTKPVASIFAPTLEKWFKGKNWKPLNERNYMRDLSMFFRWAVKKDYAAANPFDKIRASYGGTCAAAGHFTVDETSKVLATACTHPELSMLPMYAIGFFAGVRVEEIEHMKWEMIDWHEGEIRLPAAITKTGQPRQCRDFSCSEAALESNTPISGQIVSPTNLRLRRAKLLSTRGRGKQAKWPAAFLRIISRGQVP